MAGAYHEGGLSRLSQLADVLAHLGGVATVHQLHLRTGLRHAAVSGMLRAADRDGVLVEPVDGPEVTLHDRRWRLRRAG